MSAPLISFVVASYNQEHFIREAVEAAFAQTYSPLEIIISDDCSKDDTFEVARSMAAAYRGPHTVRLNRNPANLGIGGHVNFLMGFCRGELIVAGAGDDVSVPHRAEVLCRAWEESGRQATSIFSSYTIMGEDGTVQGVGGLRGSAGDARKFQVLEGDLFTFLSTKTPVVNGCAHAWSPRLFEDFGPVRADLEDLVLSFRTLAVGQLLYVAEPLVRYRRHAANVSFFAEQEDDERSFEHRESRLRWVDMNHVMAYDNMLADIQILEANGRLTPAEAARLSKEARRVRSDYALERRMIEGRFGERILALADSMRQGKLTCAVRSLPRALPRPVYRALYLNRFLRYWWRRLVRIPMRTE